jgi:phosphoribosyl 1,2-cyclic phosphate phosphodiesterase
MVAFRATHGTQDPLLYAIDDGEHRLLYSIDTGPYSDETWEAIKEYSYDVVIMDETMGAADTGSMHMGIDAVAAYRKAFEQEGLLRPRSHFLAHHMSHGANPCHEQLVDLLAPHGVEVAYDGLCLVLGETPTD